MLLTKVKKAPLVSCAACESTVVSKVAPRFCSGWMTDVRLPWL